MMGKLHKISSSSKERGASLQGDIGKCEVSSVKGDVKFYSIFTLNNRRKKGKFIEISSQFIMDSSAVVSSIGGGYVE